MAAVMVHRARGIRIAQHDTEPPIGRRKHETCGNECAQAEDRQNQSGYPATGSERPFTHPVPHCYLTMPESRYGIK